MMRFLSVTVHSFEKVESLMAPTARWLDALHDGPLVALREGVAAAATPDADVRSDWGLAGDAHMGVVVTKMNGRTSVRPYSRSAWDNMMKAVRDADVQDAAHDGFKLDHSALPFGAGLFFDLIARYPGLRSSSLANGFRFRASESLIEAVPSAASVLSQLLEISVRLAVEVAATGLYVAVEETRNYGALPGSLDTRGDPLRSKGSALVGILLSAAQLDVLGGYDQVVASAPCRVVRDLSEGPRKSVYLQVAQDAFVTTAEEREALERYLSPLLTMSVERSSPARVVDAAKRMHHEGAERRIRFEVETDEPDVDIALWFEGELSSADVEAFEETVAAWYRLGESGGFGGLMHSRSAAEQVQQNGHTVLVWTVDIGSAPRSAFSVLKRTFETMAREQDLSLVRVEIVPAGAYN